MALKKNVASQKWRIYAFDSTDGSAVTGDAANITGKISLDWAAAGGITDTNPTETEDGYYVFDLTQGETNADNLDIYPESSTANVIVVGSPASQSTVPQYFSELGIASDGDLTKVNTLDGHTAQTADHTAGIAGIPTVAEFEARTVSATAAAALEDQYDTTGLSGDTYPATQAQVANISTGSAAISTPPIASPGGFVITEGASEANNEDSTHALDGTTHDIEDAAPNTDVYYIFDVGGNGVPVEVLWWGYVNSNNDDYAVHAYNWAGATWDQIDSLSGAPGSTVNPYTFQLSSSHVGTGASLGLVHLRFYSTDGIKLATDRILCSYAVVAQSVGYADGAIWVDSAGDAGAELYVNGTADNPCPWANALTLNSTLGLNRFHIANDVTVTLAAAFDDSTMFGDHWYLELGGQSINDSMFVGGHITGIGTATDHANFDHCQIGAGTFPPSVYHDCGIGLNAGQFTAGSAGEYTFHQCYSLVAGSGSPVFDFSGNGISSSVNNRSWNGGYTATFDANCTVSHEVAAGGGTTITTGGADVEVRGICRELTLVCSAAETVQFVGICGDIGISGTTTAAINLYGVGDGVTDTSSAATVTNKLVSRDNINTEADTALSDYDAPTKTELDSAFTEIKGATWASGTDTLEHIRNKQTDIETATNELQTDWADGGRLDLLVDAILEDTGELQTDITNGGRVDLLVDGIKAVTDALTVAAATKLALSSGTMVVGTVEAGTLSTTQMTTDLSEATSGHYNDRLIIWLTGDLANQVSEVTLYTTAAGLIDHPATTEAPSAGDTFLLL